MFSAAAAATLQDSTTGTPALVEGSAIYSASLFYQTTVAPATPGSSVRFTGTVTFTVDGTNLAPQPVDTSGNSVIPVVFSTAGNHTVKARYDGDSNYAASSSALVTVVAGKAETTVLMSSSPPQVNQPVAIRAAPTVLIPASAANGGKATGTVDFLNGTVAIAGCTGLAVQSGAAVCNTTFSQLGTFTINAKYNGDANTNASAASMTLTTGKALAGTYAAFTPDAPVFGTAVTINALLMGASNVAAPTGTIAFSDGVAVLGSSAVGSDGRASIVAPSLSAGTHTVTAAYSGDTNYQTSVSAPLSIVVAKIATSIAVTAGVAQVNQMVALKATIKPSGAGTVSMMNGSTAVCTGVPTENGIATCYTKFPALGDYTISATYNGDANTAASTVSAKITVTKVAAGIYTAFTPAAPPVGAAITVNALLLGADGVHSPTGTVAFSEGTTTFATVPVDADGRASLALPNGLAIGTHSVAAAYSGDGNYVTANATPLTIVVMKAATAIALASNPPQISQPLNVKAAVTVVAPGNAPLGGTVDFTSNGKAVVGCSGVALQNGIAYCNTTLGQLGDYTIAASYSGDANTMASTATMQLGVGKAVPSIYTAFTPTAPVWGATVTVNALVLGAAGIAAPSGTVTFSEGAVTRGTFALGTDGRASLVLSAITTGTHNITAVYNGDTNYGSATADPVTVAVAKAGTSTVLAASAGAPFTATITIMAPGTGTPTGSVQFYQAGAPIGSTPVVATGSAFIATLPAGSATGSIWAVYQGDTNFAGSASQTVNLTAAVQISISSDRNPAAAGQAVTLTIRVAAAAGAVVPGGTVQITSDGAVMGAAPLSNGQATFTFTPTAGSHTVAANYSGDSNYQAASATMTLAVNRPAGPMSLTSSAAATVFGQAVTFTAQTVAPNGAAVQFLDGTVEIGSAPVSGGQATVVISTLAAGQHSITAKWAGDASTAATTSPPLVQRVEKAETSTALAVSGTNITAAVSAVAPGAGTPTGSVRFLNSETNAGIATIVVTAGVATAPLPSNVNSIVAVYSGDGNFLTSTSTALVMLQAASAASYATESFAPDELVTLFGTDLATSTVSGTGALVAMLGGTTVTITDSAGIKYAAELLYVSPGQVNFLMPSTAATGAATLAVTNANKVAVSTQIRVAAVAPGLFTMNSTGRGAPAGQILRVHAGGGQDPPQDLAALDKVQNLWLPATIDLGAATDTVYLVLYGTGLRHYQGAPVCTVGGRQAPVAYAGAQGGYAGLDQINIVLPRTLRGAGTVDITFGVDGEVSNAVTVVIQ